MTPANVLRAPLEKAVEIANLKNQLEDTVEQLALDKEFARSGLLFASVDCAVGFANTARALLASGSSGLSLYFSPPPKRSISQRSFQPTRHAPWLAALWASPTPPTRCSPAAPAP